MDTLKGQLLIAGGGLFDPNFRQAVVLIGEHNEEGALGVVLNRPSELVVADVVPALAPLVPPGQRLFFGGPVQPQGAVVLAEFSHPDFADLVAFDSIGFLTGDVPERSLEGIVRARVFAGYAGWGPGQLEAEMEQRSWILDPARPEQVFTEHPEGLWRDLLRRKGGDFAMLALMPFDPSTN